MIITLINRSHFVTRQDGITTRQDEEPVVVLGATNRPNHVDSAILRRFPRQFRIDLPTQEGRLQILKLTLKGHPLNREASEYLPQLAQDTKGYSGSDLKELCHCAARESIREIVKETAKQAVMTKSKTSVSNQTRDLKRTLRPLSVQDLKIAKTKVRRTGQDAAEYERKQFQKEHRDQNNMQKEVMMQNLAALSNLLLQSGGNLGDIGDGPHDKNEVNEIPEM